MKIGLPYNRVSSERQVNEGNGLQGQNKKSTDYISQKEYRLGKSFNDEGVSGGVIERPAMQALLKFLDEHKDDGNEYVVIIDDIKRLARDVQGHFTLKAAIYSRGATIESPNHRFEDTPEGKFVETVLAGAAELERNQNRRQVISRQKARLETGYWAFCTPRALENKKDPIHKKILVPVEPHASIFKKAIEKYRDGILLTQDEVKQYLHQEYEAVGLPNRPSLSTTVDILKNPLYAGYIEYLKWNVPFMKAKHEGFITLETYNIVQERLQGRSKPWQRRDYTSDFPLRPHVLCDACGKPMTASWNKGRSKNYPNYFCRIKGCIYNWKVVGKLKMESQFEVLLSQVKPLDEHIDLTRDVLQEQWGIRLEQYAKYRERVAYDLKEAKDGIEWYAVRARKTKDEALIATYEEKIKELIKQEKQAEQNLNKQSYTAEQFGTASEKVLNTLKKPMEMWKSDEYNDKRTILFMYFEEQLRYDYKLGFGTASLAYPVKLINELGQAKTASVEMSGSDPESETYFLITSTSVVDLFESLYLLPSDRRV